MALIELGISLARVAFIDNVQKNGMCLVEIRYFHLERNGLIKSIWSTMKDG